MLHKNSALDIDQPNYDINSAGIYVSASSYDHLTTDSTDRFTGNKNVFSISIRAYWSVG